MILRNKAKVEGYQDTFTKINDGKFSTKVVTFVVTESCDLNCTYCYEVHKSNKKMTREIGTKAIDMLFDSYNSSSHYINSDNAKSIIIEFIGGEPLLEIDLMDYLTDYFKHKAISQKHAWALNHMISVTTNGVRFNDEKVQRYIHKNKERLSFTITIDGNKELHDSCRVFHNGKGSYDIVEKSIKKQIEIFKTVYTKLTISPNNVQYLFGAVKKLRELGLSGVYANCVFEEGWNMEHADILYEQMKLLADYLIDNEIQDFYVSLFDQSIGQPLSPQDNENWCGGTGKMLAVDTKGDIYPCLRYLPFAMKNDRKPMIIGNIFEGIESNRQEIDCVACLQKVSRKSQSTEECFNCSIASGCAWCSAYNYDVFGMPDRRATFICGMHRARVRGNEYYWGR